MRISTRPDALDDERLNLLKKHGVTTVELGVQSMDDNVLKKSGRGHSSDDTRFAVTLIKENWFKIGLQIMPGLPGDTAETILHTAHDVIALTPDFVRIYPTLVIKDTPLEKMFLSRTYKPWDLKDMILICKKVKTLFDEHKIPIIRIGLQTTEELRQNIIAGPFHPSFRQLLLSRTGADNMQSIKSLI
ncbi:MAG: radical SAM protein [Deltaproteobacteria bacterium]|nr:radical SAM protein [Deltaproteobacteria bacterium]